MHDQRSTSKFIIPYLLLIQLLILVVMEYDLKIWSNSFLNQGKYSKMGLFFSCISAIPLTMSFLYFYNLQKYKLQGVSILIVNNLKFNTHVKRMSNSCQTQIKLVKNATQNYALKRDLIINACLTCKYTKELNSFLILNNLKSHLFFVPFSRAAQI